MQARGRPILAPGLPRHRVGLGVDGHAAGADGGRLSGRCVPIALDARAGAHLDRALLAARVAQQQVASTSSCSVPPAQ